VPHDHQSLGLEPRALAKGLLGLPVLALEAGPALPDAREMGARRFLVVLARRFGHESDVPHPGLPVDLRIETPKVLFSVWLKKYNGIVVGRG